jgi:uncharacterized membrane protein
MSTDPNQTIGPTDAELESLEPLGDLSEVAEAVEPAAEKTEPAEPATKAEKPEVEEKEPEKAKSGGSAFVRFLKQNLDVYTVMLGIGVIALAIGVYCLAVEMSRYNWDIKAKGHRAALSTHTFDALVAARPIALPDDLFRA